MKRLLALMALWLLSCTCAFGMERAFGYCEEGGFTVNTQGLLSTTKVQRSFVSCRVTVYQAGTLNIAVIYNDNALVATPKANPFTAASDGFWFFYAAGGKYDVRFSNSDVPLAYTRGDYLLCDPFGPNQDFWCANTGAATHNLLSTTHPDTVPYSPPEIGDLVRVNLNQMWERLGVAQVGEVLSLIDVGGGQPYPEWVWPSTLDTCTSIQVNGVESGCEHEINFTGGNVTVVATDDSANDRTNVALTSSGGSLSCDTAKVVDYYVDAAGSDVTGDGTVGNPWATVQHAWDVGVPYSIDGTYNINFSGTLTGAISLTNKFFPNGGVDYTSCSVAAPCSRVRILGTDATTENNILRINLTPTVDGASVVYVGTGISVTLEHLSIENSSYGLFSTGDSRVTLGGIQFNNNVANMEVFDNSVVFSESGIYNTDGFTNIRVTDSGVWLPFTGLAVNGEGTFTDWCPNYFGDALTSNYLSCEGTNVGYRCAEAIAGRWNWTGTVTSNNSPVFGENGRFLIGSFQYDGASGSTDPITLDSGFMSEEFTGGAGDYRFANSSGTVSLTHGAFISEINNGAGGTVTIAGHESGFNGGTQHVPTASVFYDNGTQVALEAHVQTGSTQKITIDHNAGGTPRTISMFSDSAASGTIMNLILCEDGTGGIQVDFAGSGVQGGGTLTTTGSTCNAQTFVHTTVNNQWQALGPMVSY